MHFIAYHHKRVDFKIGKVHIAVKFKKLDGKGGEACFVLCGNVGRDVGANEVFYGSFIKVDGNFDFHHFIPVLFHFHPTLSGHVQHIIFIHGGGADVVLLLLGMGRKRLNNEVGQFPFLP